MIAGLEVIEAVVQVGVEVTPYLRCGCGPEVALVVSWDAAERLRLMEFFAPSYRVLAPVVEGARGTDLEDPSALAVWLRGVIDGLGLERPLVVVRSPAA